MNEIFQECYKQKAIRTPLSLRDIPPFRGNKWGAFFGSPVRGDVGCADRGVNWGDATQAAEMFIGQLEPPPREPPCHFVTFPRRRKVRELRFRLWGEKSPL